VRFWRGMEKFDQRDVYVNPVWYNIVLCNMPILKRILHIKIIIIDPAIMNDIKVPVGNVHISG